MWYHPSEITPPCQPCGTSRYAAAALLRGITLGFLLLGCIPRQACCQLTPDRYAHDAKRLENNHVRSSCLFCCLTLGEWRGGLRPSAQKYARKKLQIKHRISNPRLYMPCHLDWMLPNVNVPEHQHPVFCHRRIHTRCALWRTRILCFTCE